MNIDRPKLPTLILLGITLSSLFFYPLFAELHDNILYLQWRRINTFELCFIFLLVALLFGIAFYSIYKCKNSYIKLLILLIITCIPLLSFLIYVLKQLFGANSIITVTDFFFVQHRIFSLFLIFILFLAMVVLFMRYPRKIVQAMILVFFILSPINISSIWSGVNSYFTDTIIIMEDSGNSGQSLSQNKLNNILIVVFDELSYDYLYENDKIKQDYDNFRNLSLVSDNYHKALSPGDSTLTAIPGLIMGKSFEGIKIKYNNIYKIIKEKNPELLAVDSSNLFAYAKEAGYKTFCFGVYLPYCKLFGKWLDGGRSFSVYNYGNLSKKFRFYNPILTTIVLLPHQFPFGLLKNPIYSLWQKNVMELSYALTIEAINSSEPFFIFAHFYPPHLPFTFDRNGYYKNRAPFLQNYDNYSKQLIYVDKILGDLIEELKNKGKFNNTTIALLSDHNYRIMFPGRRTAVPLIIKRKNQQISNDVYMQVRTEEVLKKELFGF